MLLPPPFRCNHLIRDTRLRLLSDRSGENIVHSEMVSTRTNFEFELSEKKFSLLPLSARFKLFSAPFLPPSSPLSAETKAKVHPARRFGFSFISQSDGRGRARVRRNSGL